MAKSPDAFRTISEVSAQLETPAHVLRFWESRFPQLKPVKRAGGRRYYRPDDIALLGGIKVLLHEKGMTIKGVQNLLRDRGARHVATLSALPWEGVEEPEEAATEEAPAPVAARGAAAEAPAAPAEARPEPQASSILGEFVAGTLERLREPEAPPPSPRPGIARLRDALAGADRDRLRAEAGRIAPLVRRLQGLRDGSARPS